VFARFYLAFSSVTKRILLICTSLLFQVIQQQNTIINKTLTYASETRTLTKGDRKQLNIFERKVYRRIIGLVYGNEKENWRILTNKESCARVKKTYYNRDNKVK
jgi:hypothetical protein